MHSKNIFEKRPSDEAEGLTKYSFVDYLLSESNFSPKAT